MRGVSARPFFPGPWGLWGTPSTIGGGGESTIFGVPGPPMAGQGAGQGVGFSGLASQPAGAGPQGGGGIGMGGMAMDGAMAATTAIDAMAPGAGQAARVGIQLANRGIQYMGQLASIGVSGLMRTVLPNDSPLADPSKTWAGRIIGGISGARPAAPNMAAQNAPAPQQHGASGGSALGPGGDTTINVTNNRATEGGTGRDIARMYAVGGPR